MAIANVITPNPLAFNNVIIAARAAGIAVTLIGYNSIGIMQKFQTDTSKVSIKNNSLATDYKYVIAMIPNNIPSTNEGIYKAGTIEPTEVVNVTASPNWIGVACYFSDAVPLITVTTFMDNAGFKQIVG